MGCPGSVSPILRTLSLCSALQLPWTPSPGWPCLICTVPSLSPPCLPSSRPEDALPPGSQTCHCLFPVAFCWMFWVQSPCVSLPFTWLPPGPILAQVSPLQKSLGDALQSQSPCLGWTCCSSPRPLPSVVSSGRGAATTAGTPKPGVREQVPEGSVSDQLECAF